MAKKSHKKATRNRKAILIIVLGLLLMAVLGFGMWWYFTMVQKQTDQATDDFSREQQLEGISSEADQKAQTGKVDDGAKVYDEAIKDTKDQREKSELMTDKAGLYYNQGDRETALELTLQANALYATTAASELTAQIYEEKGNKAKAIEFYKKAANLIDTSQPQGSSDRQYYLAKVKELGGRQ